MNDRTFHNRPRAFTLTEILVAIGVLLAIVLVTGRIFKVMTDVATVSTSTTAIMQDAAAIERQIRHDVSMLSREGFLTIHGVSVRNDINREASGEDLAEAPLLDPTQPADARLRCDQLVFFKEAVESSQAKNDASTYTPFPSAQSLTSMITYGHGIQLPELRGYTPRWETEVPDGAPPAGYGHDPRVSDLRSELTPWRYDNPAAEENTWLETMYTDYSSGTANIYATQTPADEDRWINASQPDARQWVLARQQVLLADDDNDWPDERSKRQYLNDVPSAMTIFAHDARQTGGGQIGGVYNVADPPVLAYGRIDVAATTLGDVRELLLVSRNPTASQQMRRCMYSTGNVGGDYISPADATDPDTGLALIEPRAINEQESSFGLPFNQYMDQRFFMKDVVCWPRAEKTSSGYEKPDLPLADRTIGSACSSFIVEWTWAEGVGECVVPRDQVSYSGSGPNLEPPRDSDCWHGIHYRTGDTLLSPRTPEQEGEPEWARDEPWLSQRWFGLRDLERGVMPFEEFYDNYPPPGSNHYCDVAYEDETMAAYAIDPYAIDREAQASFGGQSDALTEYWATFGLNQDQPDLPLDRDNDRSRDIDRSFTPMPTALRFTMTLHDPDGRLEQGVVYQFVVELPQQSQGDLAGGN